MGLTIHYRLALRAKTPDLDADYARWAVEDARRLALRMKRRGAFDEVGPLIWNKLARDRTTDWLVLPLPGDPATSVGVEISPVEGHVFRVGVGRDCEPLWIGLCRYPATVWSGGREFRTPRGPQWRLSSFSKTQYANLHGWEHFRRCHLAVVELLAALRPLGFVVKISDEGHYWPRRSERTLRAEIETMNRLVAAAAGAMKDANDEADVEAAIFAHPQFERLEAEGVAERPDVAGAVRQIAGTISWKLPRARRKN